MRVLLLGLVLTAAVTGALTAVFGRSALVPALVMGLAATGMELLALRWLRRGMASSTADAFRGFGAGMLIRLAGIGLFAVLVLWERATFSPLPTGLAYVGVAVPLLFLETRLIR